MAEGSILLGIGLHKSESAVLNGVSAVIAASQITSKSLIYFSNKKCCRLKNIGASHANNIYAEIP